MSQDAPIRTYAEFWPYYLGEHSRPSTRAWHIAGTGLATALLGAALLTLDARLLLGAAVAGYGPAWIAHFLIQKNRPATFRYPLWSLVSDVRMAAIWLGGGLERELKKAGIS